MDQETAKKVKDGSKPVFWGLLGVGGIAMIGGIIMFIFVVPRDMANSSQIPRDAALMFTNVFLDQLAFHNESGRYAAALSQINVGQPQCQQFSCRLTVPADGSGFIFRLSKEGRTWALTEKSPMPKEELPETR